MERGGIFGRGGARWVLPSEIQVLKPVAILGNTERRINAGSGQACDLEDASLAWAAVVSCEEGL